MRRYQILLVLLFVAGSIGVRAEGLAAPDVSVTQAASLEAAGFSEDELIFVRRLCLQFDGAQNGYDVIKIFKFIAASPYAADMNKLWTTQGCPSSINTTMKVPFIFNTAVDPVGREDFIYAVYKYFVKKKNSPETWTKLINTPTKEGMTFLDYIQYNVVKNQYSTTETMDAAQRVVRDLCSKGGVYAKYQATMQCPQPVAE